MNRMEASYIVARLDERLYTPCETLVRREKFLDNMLFFLTNSSELLLGDYEWRGSLDCWYEIVPRLNSLQTTSKRLLRDADNWMYLGTNLTALDISFANIYKLPESLKDLSKLRSLYTVGNPLKNADIVFELKLSHLAMSGTRIPEESVEQILKFVDDYDYRINYQKGKNPL